MNPSRWLRRPNRLSALRMLLALPLLAVFQVGDVAPLVASLSLLALMGLTDLLDGWAARRYRLESREGELIDSVADGFVRLTVFVLFLGAGLVPVWMVVIVVWRDLFSYALRFMDLAHGSAEVRKRLSGKVNGAVQSLAIGSMMLVLTLTTASRETVPLDMLHLLMLAGTLTAVWSTLDLLLTHRSTLSRFLKQRA
ncbi:CDP-diacylglycerol--glycerol-3-phosphate 3-phosphatidyltransferase [Deinobacterium chartae]|uniref:CDP-diacylglycerol--glycerol-3-phosphate 3-phosphatidyltransferase n=1 Tax=Deinobacterium chartae TaxID=521158 RepID=A0A841HW51_9DEIO|nr:CDP-alcohol phosphatidyltransferase family protein [Deinobacterium chartae]MBB6097761.1 CDP-diacylglycerol--glycerol-3-phosphate 3-phosphatidyltransferase [Deinobacterium chartae]